MIQIAAPLPRASYAPELYALADYLEEQGDMRLAIMNEYPSGRALDGFDAVYLKMGFAPFWRSTHLPEVHDYASAAVGRMRWVKNAAKSHLSRRPVLRSFLSPSVRAHFSFMDRVPYVFRDMGVPDHFYDARERRPDTFDYDLFYAGSITESRNSRDLFRAVENARLKLLAVGEPQPSIYADFCKSPWVDFAGVVPYREIPSLALRSRFGVNLTPDVSPLNFQTSTKVIEYLAMGLPVITNNYRWVHEFEAETGARMLKLASFDELSIKIHDFDYVVPDMTQFSWRNIFNRSEINPALVSALR